MKAALVVAAALLAAACSPPLMKLPTGLGVTVGAAEASAALAQAIAACAPIRTLTAEIAVSGSAAGHRLRGRLSVGVSAPASVRIEAVAPFGQPFFIFAAVEDDATLLLPRDTRVLEHGRPDAVLDAVAGIPLSAADLDTTLTGCVPAAATTTDGRPVAAKQFGDAWLVLGEPEGDEVYLRRATSTGPWVVAAVVRRPGNSTTRWRADYGDRRKETPESIRLTSLDAGGRTGQAFDLRLALSQIDLNVPLGPDVFTVAVPGTATRMTLDELRQSGVMGAR